MWVNSNFLPSCLRALKIFFIGIRYISTYTDISRLCSITCKELI